MTERTEQFRVRRAALNKRSEGGAMPVVDVDAVENLLSQDVDWSLIGSLAVEVPVFNQDEITDEAVSRCLSALDRDFSRKKYDALFEGVRSALIDQLLGPLGLSRSDLMESDRKFLYKDAKEDYGVTNRTRKDLWNERQNADGTGTDAYTRQRLDKGRADLDHVIPRKELHDRGGFMSDSDERQRLGNEPNNLEYTDQSINRSKQDGRLEDVPSADKRRTKSIQNRAEKAIESQLPNSWQIARRGMRDGVEVGTKQGLQQAFGLLVSELISAIFFEVKDVLERGWKGGEYDLSWLKVLKERLDRVQRRLLARWRDVAVAFGKGWLSGFLSATMTAMLNMFVRTGRNVVRILREGLLSIVNAIHVLLAPPDGMSLREAAHEATKVLAAGLVVTGGILAGEAIAQSFGFLGALGDVLASVLGGLISGLGSLFVIYMLDKLDLFGVAFDERHSFVMGTLEARVTETTTKIEGLAAELGLTESSSSDTRLGTTG